MKNYNGISIDRKNTSSPPLWFERFEQWVHHKVEEVITTSTIEKRGTRINSSSTQAQPKILPIQTLYLSCNNGQEARVKKEQNHKELFQNVVCINWKSGMKLNLQDLGLDIHKPIFIPNLSSFHNQQIKPLSLNDLSSSPMGDLQIKYFSDATKVGALKPNSETSLREIVHNVTNDLNSTIKIGTQVPVDTYPSLIHNIAPNDIVTKIFGNHFHVNDLSPYLGIFPPLTTVPIFLARGLKESIESTTCEESDKEENEDYHNLYNTTGKNNVRTDLHCEPIGNISIQLEGSKKWTLVSPKYSRMLHPTVSKHGRAFFYSKLNPLDPNILHNIPHYELVTNKGDGVWIPPWTWHRVDYIPGTVAFAASLFHFRPLEFFMNNPLFALLIVPNLIKEIFKVNIE